jgi:hypothetical protein
VSSFILSSVRPVALIFIELNTDMVFPFHGALLTC